MLKKWEIVCKKPDPVQIKLERAKLVLNSLGFGSDSA